MAKWISVQNLIGGMALGFEKVFGSPEAIITNGVKNDNLYINYCNETRHLNIPVYTMNSDYTEIVAGPTETLPEADIYVMTPVCAGLSMLNSSTSGKYARGDADNCQNQNMYNLTRLAMRNKAKIIAFENAPALYTKTGEGVVVKLQEIADEYGYTFGLFATNTLYHGIPQSRKRTFALFYRDTNPALFNFEHIQYKDFCEYLEEIPKDSKYYDYEIGSCDKDIYVQCVLELTGAKTLLEATEKLNCDKSKPVYTMLMLTMMCGLENSINWFENKLKENYNEYTRKQLKFLYHCKEKLKDGKGYFDATGHIYMHGHTNAIISKNLLIYNNKYNRYLNARELMYMMGLPHDFNIDIKRELYMITQNVPVCTAAYIAKQVSLYLNNELPISNKPFVKQNNHKMKIDIG